jgi:hypothetical protein
LTLVAGVPLIVGVRFGSAWTLIENALSEADARPSLTEITMFAYVPTCEVVGVPDKRPVDVLNDAQAGRFAMEYVSESPSASLPAGMNE